MIVKTASEIPAAAWYVLSNDSFLSGWGPAEGKINTVVAPCKDLNEAKRVAEYARSRSDQKRVRIVGNKPRIKNHVVYSLLSHDRSPAWYGEE